jgi:Thiamine pyrophosphate enzyme, C-terminal TPP binding domain
MLGLKLTIVIFDNSGFGCIDRLQTATGGASFNNLLKDARHETLPAIDFAAHAASLGAIAHKIASIAELERAVSTAKANDRTTVLVIETDPQTPTKLGGRWWDVPVPQVSPATRSSAHAPTTSGRFNRSTWSIEKPPDAPAERRRCSASGQCHPARAGIARFDRASDELHAHQVGPGTPPAADR